jgi:DNA-binding transcriptional ArsR family regulator
MKVEDKDEARKSSTKASPALVFALNHGLRRRILRFQLKLPQGASASPVEISEALDRPLSNVSYHVRVLIEKGAVILTSTRPVRGSVEHFYRPSETIINNKWVAKLLRDTRDEDDTPPQKP